MTSMSVRRNQNERGAISGSVIAIACLSILVLGLGATTIWAYMNYTQEKTDVDEKTAIAVASAQKNQADADEAKFAIREEQPYREFVGPDDYGRVEFMYPKTWSVYVANDGSNGGDYDAYLNPVSVPPVSVSQQFSLRVSVQQESYDQVLASYEQLVKVGNLVSSATSANGNDGTRLDGNFSNDIRGAAVVYKIRGETLTIRTDADTFLPDFNTLIKTIKFNA